MSTRFPSAALPRKKDLPCLSSGLSPVQVAQYEKYGYFEVMGGDSGKHYRIRPTRQMNVDELDQHGVRIAAWCFSPEGDLPIGDVMLAQKIALENNEQAALALANRGSRYEMRQDSDDGRAAESAFLDLDRRGRLLGEPSQ